jgi:hypothetical protein
MEIPKHAVSMLSNAASINRPWLVGMLLFCAIAPGLLQAQVTLDPIKAGVKTITGKSTKTDGSIKSVKVNDVEEIQATQPVQMNGTFSVALNDPVQAGNFVVVTQVPAAGASIVANATVTATDIDMPTIEIHDLVNGDLRVTGRSSLKGKAVLVQIQGTDQTKGAAPPTVGPDGTFSVDLKAPVKTGNLVDVTFVEPGTISPALAEAKPQVLDSAEKADVIALNEPREGDKAVNGSITANETLVVGVKIEVLEGDRRIEQVDAAYDSKKKTFASTLTNPLTEGFSVHAHAVDVNGKVIGDTAGTVMASGYDWGRVRAYFTLGAQVVRTQQSYVPGSTPAGASFGSPDAYVGLNVDTNYWNSLPRQARCPHPTADEVSAKDGKTLNRRSPCREVDKPKTAYLLNSYVEVRLTQVATSADGSVQSVGNFQGFWGEGGVYLPIVPAVAQWNFRGQDNGLFFGPLAKIGFQAAKVASPSGSPADLGSTDVFQFYGFGGRFGHFKMPQTPGKEAPEILNYVDVTVGKWDNFRIFTPTGPTRYERPWRMDVTARLKIPSTPLFVGTDVNVGPGVDDVRILFGARVDLTKALGALIPAVK